MQQAIAGTTALAGAGEVIVVNDASTDGSAALAQAAGAQVVTCVGRGYGAAPRTGIATARGRYVVVADADATYALGDLSAFWQKLRGGDYLVIGNRFSGGMQPGAMPFLHRHLGNPLLSAIGRLAFGVRVTDFHCGIRAFNRDAILALRLSSDGMEFATEMIAKAAASLVTDTRRLALIASLRIRG